MNSFEIGLLVGLGIMSAGIVLVFVRLSVGPSLPDRVVAFELLSSLVIGIIAVSAMATNQPAFLDVAIILALVSFLGTVAFAFYIQQRGSK
jgi:multicomponent Na+:H+ antiporter subunit F